MAELPEDFDCTITNWEYIYGLCRAVADDVRADAFEPDIVVALARGGWFAGRCLCDFLGPDDLTSLKVEHYVGTAEKSGEPAVRYPMPQGSVEGKDVLIIDDIADTGGSMNHAHEYVRDRDAGEAFTAEEIRTLLNDHHGIERIEMEIAQPDRLPEVLSEMERREVLEADGDRWRLAG